MPDLEFPTGTGAVPGYLASPAAEHGPATIVLQEWWGLEEHIRSVCDRFAAEGFFALAPDLFRGDSTTKPSEAQQKLMALSMDRAEQDMCGAAEFLSSHEGVVGSGIGSVGFCLGGGLSVWTATTCPEVTAAVSYYYVLPHGKPDFAKLKGPVQGHFGEADDFISPEQAGELEREIKDAGGEATFYTYDGATHAFFNDSSHPERVGVYEPAAAQSSWERTVSFLRSALTRSS